MSEEVRVSDQVEQWLAAQLAKSEANESVGIELIGMLMAAMKDNQELRGLNNMLMAENQRLSQDVAGLRELCERQANFIQLARIRMPT